MEQVRKRIPSLDGIRALAVVLVILGHSLNFLPWEGWPKYARVIYANQMLGVTFFFTLSGFLITTLLLKEKKRSGRIRLGRFYLRRSLRILPPFYIFVAAMVAASSLGWFVLHPGSVVCSLLFVWNYYTPVFDWELSHTWTLSMEEQFYLLWPATVAWLGIFGSRRLAIVLILASPAIRMLTFYNVHFMRGLITIMLHTRVDSLMCGCLLALVFEEPVFKKLAERVFRAGIQYWVMAYVFLIAPFLSSRFAGRFTMPFGYSLEAMSAAILIAWVVIKPDTRVGRFLNWRPVVHVGLISYSLYLWQQPFTPQDPHSVWLRFPLNLIPMMVMGELSYRLVEKNSNRLRDWYLRRRPPAAAGLYAKE